MSVPDVVHNKLDIYVFFVSFQIYMGVFWQGGKLGLAYYDVESTQIYMMMDSIEHDDFVLLKRGIELYFYFKAN